MKSRTLPALLSCLMLLIAISVPVQAAAEKVERIEKGNLVLQGIPEIPERMSNRLRQYQNVRGVRSPRSAWRSGSPGRRHASL